MKQNKLEIIDKLIKEKKIDEAQFNLSKLGSEYYRNFEYLYLRSKIFYINKLYYIAIDTLLISLEFEKKDKIYNLIAEIYDVLGNKDLSKKISNPKLRLDAINSLKDELSGIYRKIIN
jgi:flagellin-specific chaperone FliS